MSEITLSKAQITQIAEQVAAILSPDAPAKVRKTTTRKPAARKTTTRKGRKPVLKGDRAFGSAETRKGVKGLTRKEFNDTLSALARTRPAGSGAYKALIADWDRARELRLAGLTPNGVLEALGL